MWVMLIVYEELMKAVEFSVVMRWTHEESIL